MLSSLFNSLTTCPATVAKVESHAAVASVARLTARYQRMLVNARARAAAGAGKAAAQDEVRALRAALIAARKGDFVRALTWELVTDQL